MSDGAYDRGSTRHVPRWRVAQILRQDREGTARSQVGSTAHRASRENQRGSERYPLSCFPFRTSLLVTGDAFPRDA